MDAYTKQPEQHPADGEELSANDIKRLSINDLVETTDLVANHTFVGHVTPELLARYLTDTDNFVVKSIGLTDGFFTTNEFLCHQDIGWSKTFEFGFDRWNIIVLYMSGEYYLNIYHLKNGLSKSILEFLSISSVHELQHGLRLFGLNELADNLTIK